jgi:cation transport ATPase
VAFDKTGTLTESELSLSSVDVEAGGHVGEALALAAALEEGSRHPLGRALAKAAHERGVAPAAVGARRFQVGGGVSGRDADGRALALGSPRFVGRSEPGNARVLLLRDGQLLARFRFVEAIRPEARAAIEALREDGVSAFMLTGDSPARAAEVASALGLPALAQLSAIDKVARLGALGDGVAMVGDGLNDAPALAGTIGFAMRDGAGLSRGMAQVTLLVPDLRLIPWALALSRRALRLARRNLALSTLYNLAFLALALGGALRPLWAGVSMLTSSLLVLGSSLRVTAWPGPRP